MSDVPATRGLYGQRPSKSADAARRREFEETFAMSPMERVLLALELGEVSLLLEAPSRSRAERGGER
ncbi:hypothetical protein [Archangium sp. Cb G35]|uniref:hypothetical protein n=1 Tax=Archangium sp. Cb G35 TaxID=1920190 RepID=UPI000A5E8771|nr:hypothetical protein [Archangium sp. Cb G35]